MSAWSTPEIFMCYWMYWKQFMLCCRCGNYCF